MSFPSNRSRHVLSPSSSSHSYTRVSMRPNLSWSTIREESSADLLSSEDNDKKDRLNRLKKLERLKERRYMDYQSLKRRGSSKEYSERFQRDCEEFNKLRYRQVHHTPNSFTISHQQRSASVSDLSSRRLHSSRYGANYSFLRGNQDDGQTLSPTGSISSIVTLDDNYMYGSGYPTEDLWRPRSRTSSFSTRDRMAYYGLSHSHDMEDSLFDDVSSEYGYSSYVPQRRAFSSCVTPRMYSGIMTPTAQSADAMATYERMNQLSERLRLLQSERVQLDQRSSVDHSSSQTRSRLSSFDNTESATASSVHSRFNQTSQQILPQSPTDHSIPAWSQRVSLLLSAQQHEVPFSPSDANYRSSHVGHGSHYTDSFSRNSPDIVDSMHSTEEANIHSYHGLNQSHSPTVRSSVLSRSFVYHRPESSSTPISTTTTSAMGHDRVDVQSPGHLSSAGSGTHFDPTSPISPSHSYKDRHEFPTSPSRYKTSIRDANQNANLDPSTNSFSRTEYSTRVFKDDRQRLIDDNTVDNFSRTTNPSHFTSDMSPSPVSPDFHKNVFGVRERRYVVTHGQQQEPQLSGQDDVSDSGVESSSDVGRVSTSVSTDSISKFMVSASKPSESRGKAKFEISLEPSAQSEVNSELSTNVSTPHASVEADKYISSKNIDVSRKEKMVEVENPALTKMATMNLEISQPKTSGISHLPEDKTLFEPNKTDSEIKENATSTTTIVKTADTYSTQMKEQLPGIDVQSFKSTDPIKDTKSQVSISTNTVSETVPFDKETERIEIHSKRPNEKYMDNVSEILSSTQKETSMISKTISNKMESDDVSAEKSVGESHPEEAVCGNGSLDVTESRNQDISDQNGVTSKKKKSKKKKKNGVDTVSVSTTEEISVSTVESSVDLRPDSSGLDGEKSQQKVSVSSKLLTKNESDNLEKAANLPMETFTSPTPQSSNEMVISKMEDVSDIYQNGTKGDFSGIDLGSSVDYKETVKQQDRRLKNISLNVDANSKIPETVVQTTTKTDVEMDKSVVASDVDPIFHQNQIVITPSKVPLLEREDGCFQTENIQSKSPQNENLKTKTGSTKSSKLDNTVTVSEKELQTSNGTAKVTLVKTEQLMDATRKSVEKLQSGDLNSLENETKAIKPTPVSTKLTSTSFQASSSVDNLLIQEPSKMKGNPSAIYEDISTKTVVQETIEPEYPVTDSPMKGIPSENDKSGMKKEKSKKKKKNSSKNGKKDDKIDSSVKESVQIITKDTAEVSPSKPDSFSAVFPSQQEVNISDITPQTGLPEKIVVTSLTKTTVSKMSESPEEYDVKSVSAELPGQTPQLKEFSQGNMVDKTASTDKIAGSKMAQRIPDELGDYKIKSFSAEFPRQSTELSKDGEITSSVTTITKTTSIEVESSFDKGKELATKKLQNAKLSDQVDNSNEDPHAKILTSTEKSQRPKELDISSIPTEQTENSKDSSETSFFGRVASTLKNTFSKLSPEIPEKSEFAVPSIADFSADSSTSVDPLENSKDQAPYNTTNSVVTMLSEPQAYNTKSVTGKLLEKHEDPKLVTSPEQGDTFGKVTTMTTTKTVEYKTSEVPEEYNLQKFSAELPGCVKVSQQTVPMKDNVADKVGTITEITGSKMSPGMSERPREYQPHSVSVQSPGQIKSPTQIEFSQGSLADKSAPTVKVPSYKMIPGMSDKPQNYQSHSVSAEFPGEIKPSTQTEFNQDDLTDKVVTTTVTSVHKMVPEMSNTPVELKTPSLSVNLPVQVPNSKEPRNEEPATISTEIVTTTETIVEKVLPGISNSKKQPCNVPASESLKETAGIQQGDLFGKEMITMKDVAYKKDSTDLEKPVDLKAQTISVEIPEHQLDLKKAKESTTSKVNERNPDESKSNSVQTKAMKQPKEQFEKDKPGFLDKVTPTVNRPYTKKSEELPELMKESLTIDQNTTNMPSNDKTSYTSISESDVLPKTAAKMHKPIEDGDQENEGVSLGKDCLHNDNSTRVAPELTESRKLQPIFASNSQQTDGKDVHVVQTTRVTEVNSVQSNSMEIPITGTDVKLVASTPETSLTEKDFVTSITKTTISQVSEVPEEYNWQKISTRVEEQDMADTVKSISKATGIKMPTGTSERPETYQTRSVSVEFPGQIKSPTQTEFSQGTLADKVAPKVKVPSYKMAPRMSERPEEYQPHSVSVEFPGQIKSPTQTEFSQGTFADKMAPTVKVPSYKMAPGMSERPEEYQPHSVSVEFPGQIKSPTQTEFSQGTLADKMAPTVKVPSYKIAPGMSERPEEYQPHSVSVEFPGQIQSPTQTEFSQGTLADKVAPTVKVSSYKMAPGISERPEEYQPHSVSVEFPGQIKSPTRTEFSQGTLADKVVTTTVSSGYKSVPSMSELMVEPKVMSMYEEFPGHVSGLKPDQSLTHVSQISYKTVLEKDINAPFNNNDTTSNVSSISSGEHPDAKTTSFETSHLALEKPVTIIKKSMNLMNSSRTQEPETSLSQHDPKYVLSNSTELQENLKNFGTDAATLSSDFLTTSVEPATLTRSDIVKNSKTDDASVEKSHKNISFPLSIDKVEKSGDRSSHPQQTENEGRFMSGGPEAMVLASPKMLEHAGVLSEDAVAPLKSKPVHPDKPVLRKLSGHDLLVSDIQKTRKPSLKLVAPDCTLLQTKFETDGWKPKVKSPTTTGATIVQAPNNDANTQAIISENISVSPPVPPKRRSREFRSMSVESTSSDLPSPTSPLDSKIAADPQITSPQPQVPKRKNRKGSKTDRSSVSPDPSGATDANVSLDLDRSRPISHPGFRVPDPDQDTDVFKDSSHLPSSHLSNENREKMIAGESADPLNKSPHTSVTSEIQMRSPKVNQPPPSDHTDSVFVNTPSPDDPPFERTLSSDRSRTMPLNRKKINRRSHDNNDSDSDEKLKSQLSPTTRWKSAEILKGNPAKTETPPKNTGLNRVKSTSIKLLSKLQPKSKKAKSPGPTNDEGKPDDAHPDDSSGHGATREYPNVEKYPANKSSAPSPPTTPQSENPEETAAAHAPVAPLKIPLPLEEHDEPIKERVYLNSWDPTPLLKELYEIRLMEDDTQDLSHKFITMEGQMEKLPMNKKKATLLKTWKRRYFKAENGWLNYYDNQNDEKPSDAVLLMGGQIHAMGNNVIGIDDGRGRYLMVRCPSQTEYKQWLIALESQTPDNSRATYVRPSMNALKHPDKKVVMIELGSMSVRAGTLKAQATLPQLFFPNIVAVSTEDNRTKHVIGFDAYKPNIRRTSHLVQPLGPTDKVDKFKFDYETLPSVFRAIFQDLKIASAEYQVMLILPMNIRDEDKTILMNILMGQFKVRGVLMASQALLALYSYNAQSGIVVDIGERLEVLPIYEGFVIDGGHTVQSFGAPKIRQSLRSGLTCENYPLYSPLEQILVRFIMEDTCFVSKNFNEECKQYQKNPEKYKDTVYLKKYDLPEETYSAISHSLSRFVSPEGLFNTDLWGMDYPTIQSLVKNAIEACSMDNRRHLCRSIYLSGGVTLLPGFASRLEAELCKQLHDSLIIQVHASPQRYHAAYVGACTLCSSPEFEESCISSEEWKTDGAKAFQKWKMSS